MNETIPHPLPDSMANRQPQPDVHNTAEMPPDTGTTAATKISPTVRAAANIAVWPVIAAGRPDESSSSWTSAQAERAVLLARDPRIAKIARMAASRWQHPDADVLHADIIIRVARSNGTKFDEENFLGYTKKVAEGLCIDSYRYQNSQKRPRTVPLETTSEGDNTWSVKINEKVAVEGHEDTVIRQTMLTPLLQGLSATHRDIVELVYFGGLEVPEAALRLGIPLGTAKSRIWHALRHMRKKADVQGLTFKEFLSP